MAVPAGVIVAAGGLLWWFTNPRSFALDLTGRGLLIGLTVGLLTTILGLGKPTAKRLAASAPWASRPYLVPGEPPPPPVYFIGRDAVLEDAVAILTPARLAKQRPVVLLIHGQPGVGKSGLALTAAASVARRFRDGVVYASMTDATVGSARLHNVLGDMVDSLQGRREKVPATTEGRRKELRRLTRRKSRVLFVLDDVVDARAVEAVIPASSRSAVLMTSRTSLDLRRPVNRLELRPLSIDDSVKLLCFLLLGAAEPDEATRAAIWRVAVSAAGYPVALHLAVRAITSRGLWALPELTANLPDEVGHLDEQTARERMLDLNVNTLSDSQRRALLSLAWLPTPTFVPWMVQALADLPEERDAWLICERLADQRLLERVAPDATGVVQLRLPDSVAGYVRARVSRQFTDDERTRALQRLKDAPARRRAASAAEVMELLNQGRVAQALDEARGALAEAVRGGDPLDRVAASHPAGREALAMLAEVLAELGGLDDAMEVATAQQRARLESRPRERHNDLAEARLRRNLGRLLRRSWRLAESERTLKQAYELARLEDDADEKVSALRELALVESMRTDKADGIARANKTLKRAHDLLDSCENATYLECRLIEASVMVLLNGVGRHRATADQLRDALTDIDRALAILPNEFALWRAWLTYQQARVLIRQAEDADRATFVEIDDGNILSGPDQARRLRSEARWVAESALEAFAAMSHRYGSARCRLEIGRIYAVEHSEAAVSLLEEARETFFFCGDRWIEAQTALVLANVRARGGVDVNAAHAELDFAERVFEGLRDRYDLERVQQVRRSLRGGSVARRIPRLQLPLLQLHTPNTRRRAITATLTLAVVLLSAWRDDASVRLQLPGIIALGAISVAAAMVSSVIVARSWPRARASSERGPRNTRLLLRSARHIPQGRQAPMLSHFRGRDEELRQWTKDHRVQRRMREAGGVQSESPVVLAMFGPPGVGKSALAHALSRRLAKEYPDGLCVASFGTSGVARGPADVTRDLLLQLGWPEKDTPGETEDRVATLRSITRDKRILFLFDAARDHDQVRHVLPAEPKCAVIITSRREIATSLGFPAQRPIGPMTLRDALEMLGAIAGIDWTREPETAVELVEMLGRLPMAIRSAAERIRDGEGLRHVTAIMRPPPARLHALNYGGRSIKARIASEFDRLSATQRRALTLLASLDSESFVPWVLRPLMELEHGQSTMVVTGLAAAQFVEEVGRDHTGQARYRIPLLTRLFALQEQDESDVEAARRRFDEAYIELVDEAISVHDPSYVLVRTGERTWRSPDSATARRISDNLDHVIRREYLNLVRIVQVAHPTTHAAMIWRVAALLDGRTPAFPQGPRSPIEQATDISRAFERGIHAAQLCAMIAGEVDVRLAQAQFLIAVERYHDALSTLDRASKLIDTIGTSAEAVPLQLRVDRVLASLYVETGSFRLAETVLSGTDGLIDRLPLAAIDTTKVQVDIALIGQFNDDVHRVAEGKRWAAIRRGQVGSHDIVDHHAQLAKADELRRKGYWDDAAAILRDLLNRDGDARTHTSTHYRLAMLQVDHAQHLAQTDQRWNSVVHEAIQHAAACAFTFGTIGDPVGQVRARTLLVRALVLAQNLMAAMQLDLEIETDLDAVRRDEATAVHLESLTALYHRAHGEVEIAHGRPDSAWRSLVEAVRGFQRLNDWSNHADTWVVLNKVYDTLDRPISRHDSSTTDNSSQVVDDSRQTLAARNLPPRTTTFRGRQQTLDELRNSLSGGGPSIFAVYGPGGVGKTQLVLEYAHRFAGDYDIVWWIQAQQPELIAEQLAALAIAMRVVAPGATTPMAVQRTMHALRTRSRWLVVFDNVSIADDIKLWLPGGAGHVIITSRSSGWSDIAIPLKLAVFERAESMTILRSQVEYLSTEDADEIAGRLGDLPLAISQAAAVMVAASLSAGEYLRRLDNAMGSVAQSTTPPDNTTPLVASVQLALDRLQEQDRAGGALMSLAAHLSADPIPMWMWETSASILSDPIAYTLLDGRALRQALNNASRYGLTRFEADQTTMHKLAQAAIRASQTPLEQEAHRRAAELALAAANPGDPSNPDSWLRWGQILPHILAIDPASTTNRDMMRLACDAVYHLYGRGDNETARPIAQHLYETWRTRFGETDPQVLAAAMNLSAVNTGLGAYEYAREIDEQILANLRSVVGDSDPAILAAAVNLTSDLRQLGQFETAQRIAGETLDAYERANRDEQPPTQAASVGLAELLRQSGDYEEAKKIAETTYLDCQSTYGKDHPDTLVAATGLADMLRQVGQYEDAKQLAEETLTRYRLRFGSDHPNTYVSATNLAEVLRQLGQYREARDLDRAAFNGFRKQLGPEHLTTLASAVNLAIDLRELGEDDEARSIDADTITSYRRLAGTDNREALALIEAGDLRKLIQYEQAQQIAIDMLGRRRRLSLLNESKALQALMDGRRTPTNVGVGQAVVGRLAAFSEWFYGLDQDDASSSVPDDRAADRRRAGSDPRVEVAYQEHPLTASSRSLDVAVALAWSSARRGEQAISPQQFTLLLHVEGGEATPTAQRIPVAKRAPHLAVFHVQSEELETPIVLVLRLYTKGGQLLREVRTQVPSAVSGHQESFGATPTDGA